MILYEFALALALELARHVVDGSRPSSDFTFRSTRHATCCWRHVVAGPVSSAVVTPHEDVRHVVGGRPPSLLSARPAASATRTGARHVAYDFFPLLFPPSRPVARLAASVLVSPSRSAVAGVLLVLFVSFLSILKEIR